MKFLGKLVFIGLLILPSAAFAQSSLHCLVNERYFPVVEIKGRQPICFNGNDIERSARSSKLTLLSAQSFGKGFVKVRVDKNERNGVYQNNGILQFSAAKSWYLFRCVVVSDRDLERCYVVLAFDEYGEKSYRVRELGRLEAGKEKVVEISTVVNYQMPDQLHIFSGMEEVRTSLVPERYSYDNGKFELASN